MKISVITISFNSAPTIRDSIDSFLAQKYPDKELVVIDGGSTDGTVEILHEYGGAIHQRVSEKDHGLYDAMNKGIERASGEVIGMLNSDDFFAAPDNLSKVAAAFEDDTVGATYADLHYVDNKNSDKIIRKWQSGKYDVRKFLRGWMPPHPTFYLRKRHYEKFGNYRTDFAISADYELMLRMLYRYKLKATYIPEVLVKMRTGGTSNASVWRRLKAHREDRMAWRVNNLKPDRLTLMRKPLSKLAQYF